MKTFQDGDPLFGVMMNAIANLWPNGTAVLSGCTPTGSGAARQVTVAAGTVVIGGTVRPVSQQTKTLDAAAFDRYDLISVNTSGTVVVTKGTDERRVPALPANSVTIAICLIETGQTTLPADRIFDARLISSHMPTGAMLVDEIRERTPGGKIQLLNTATVTTAQAIPSDHLRHSNDTVRTTKSASAVKVKETTLGGQLASQAVSSFRVSWEMAGIQGKRLGSYLAVNGVQWGETFERYVSAGEQMVYFPQVRDVTNLKAGDKIQVYAWNASDCTTYIRNLRLYADIVGYTEPPTPTYTSDM